MKNEVKRVRKTTTATKKKRKLKKKKGIAYFAYNMTGIIAYYVLLLLKAIFYVGLLIFIYLPLIGIILELTK